MFKKLFFFKKLIGITFINIQQKKSITKKNFLKKSNNWQNKM